MLLLLLLRASDASEHHFTSHSPFLPLPLSPPPMSYRMAGAGVCAPAEKGGMAEEGTRAGESKRYGEKGEAPGLPYGRCW